MDDMNVPAAAFVAVLVPARKVASLNMFKRDRLVSARRGRALGNNNVVSIVELGTEGETTSRFCSQYSQ